MTKTDAEWRARLSDLAYKVTRKHATEPAFSHDAPAGETGIYRCICCGADLFDANDRFESGTGWPSFSAPVAAGAIHETEDRSLFMRRTAVACARCDAHLGHVFADGPTPTRARYCINGVALDFKARQR